MSRRSKQAGLCTLLLMLLVTLLAGCAQSPPQDAARSPQTASGPLTGEPLKQYQAALTQAADGDYDKAQHTLESLSRARPRHPGVWLNLASTYYQQKRLEPAAEALAKAQALEPNNAAAYNLKGILALESGDTKMAESLFRKALERDETLADAHYNLALLYDTYYQDIATAVKHYKAYLKLHPGKDEITEQWVQQLERSLEN